MVNYINMHPCGISKEFGESENEEEGGSSIMEWARYKNNDNPVGGTKNYRDTVHDIHYYKRSMVRFYIISYGRSRVRNI